MTNILDSFWNLNAREFSLTFQYRPIASEEDLQWTNWNLVGRQAVEWCCSDSTESQNAWIHLSRWLVAPHPAFLGGQHSNKKPPEWLYCVLTGPAASKHFLTVVCQPPEGFHSHGGVIISVFLYYIPISPKLNPPFIRSDHWLMVRAAICWILPSAGFQFDAYFKKVKNHLFIHLAVFEIPLLWWVMLRPSTFWEKNSEKVQLPIFVLVPPCIDYIPVVLMGEPDSINKPKWSRTKSTDCNTSLPHGKWP